MAKQINIPQLVTKLRGMTSIIDEALSQAANVAAVEALADYKRRIFHHGRTRTGGKIGSYSTTPTYVSIAGAKRAYGSQVKTGNLRPRGKDSKKAKFKNGKRRKSRYEEKGYAGLRNTLGRQSAYMDFRLTGELERSIQVGRTKNGTVIGFINDKQYEKADNLETQTGKAVFTLSEKEIDKALDRVEKELDEQLTKIFS